MTSRDASDRERLEAHAELSSPDTEATAVRAAVRAVRGGEIEAFARLVELYQRRLFALALMFTRQPDAAEEVTQDAFVRAFTHLDAYDERRPFYPWLATIGVRLAQNWTSQRGRAAAREEAAAEKGMGRGIDPLEALIADESSRSLWRSVAELPPGERTAAILYYRQEMTVGEIARALGVTDGTVKTFLFRARQKLRRSAPAMRPGKDTL